MQKYFNIIYAVVLIALAVFVVKIQLFDKVSEVQSSLQAQSETLEELQGDIASIVGAINSELSSGGGNQ